MSGLDIVSVQENIIAYIRQEFPGYDIYEDYVLDDVTIMKLSNNIKPYVVINWNGLNRSQLATSFVGVRHDEYNSGMDIAIISSNAKQSRKALNVFLDKLIGWKPANGGTLIPFDSAATYIINEGGTPQVYVALARLVFAVNVTNIGAYITP